LEIVLILSDIFYFILSIKDLNDILTAIAKLDSIKRDKKKKLTF